MIGLGIFDAIQSGLMAAMNTQTGVVLILSFIVLVALFMIGFDPILAMVFAAMPFLLLSTEGMPVAGITSIAVLVFGFAIAMGLARIFFR